MYSSNSVVSVVFDVMIFTRQVIGAFLATTKKGVLFGGTTTRSCFWFSDVLETSTGED